MYKVAEISFLLHDNDFVQFGRCFPSDQSSETTNQRKSDRIELNGGFCF